MGAGWNAPPLSPPPRCGDAGAGLGRSRRFLQRLRDYGADEGFSGIRGVDADRGPVLSVGKLDQPGNITGSSLCPHCYLAADKSD